MAKSRLLSLLCLVFTVFSVFSVFFTVPVYAALRSPPYVHSTVVFDTRLIDYPVAQQGYTTQNTNITPLFSFVDSSDVDWYVYRIQVTTEGNLTGTQWTLDSYSSVSDSVLSDVVWSRYDARLVFYSATTPNATTSDLVQLPLYNYTQQLWNVESMPAVSVEDGYTYTFDCLDYFYEVANSETTNINNGYLINRFAWANDYRTYSIPEEELDDYVRGFNAGYTEGFANGYKGGLKESVGPGSSAGYWAFGSIPYSDNLVWLLETYWSVDEELGSGSYSFPIDATTYINGENVSVDKVGVYLGVQQEDGSRSVNVYYHIPLTGEREDWHNVYTGPSPGWKPITASVLYFSEDPSLEFLFFLNTYAYYTGPVFIYDAYQVGYLAGVESNTSQDFVRDILGETLAAPVRGLDSIILYQAGDVTITLWGVLGSAIVLLLFVAFLKMFAGG